MIIHRAAWVLPVAARPIRDGWVAVNGTSIAAVGGPGDEPPPGQLHGFSGPVAILPGLVNAHTHLELSWMRGRVPPSDSFDEWIRGLVALRRQSQQSGSIGVLDAARDALGEARAAGTALVGDISNTLETPQIFRDAAMAARVFYELIGFNTPTPGDDVRRARARVEALGARHHDLRVGLAPHAPYSVSVALFDAIREDLDANPDAMSSVHLGESRDEVEFLRGGGGPIRAALETLGAWHADWTPPGCGPVEYMARLGLLNRRVLIVHGVQLTDDELRQVKGADATIVTCPRSNRWTGAGPPPVSRFYASGARVAVGTDSLASVDDLNLFHELADLRRLAPEVPAATLLDSATRAGAAALGFAADFGAIQPGMRAALIAVRVPPGVEDVEEYLVGGIEPDAVEWIDDPD